MKGKLFRPYGVLVAAILVLPSLGFAQSKPINVALFDPIQIFPQSTPITGLRINLIYGNNVSMLGLDWGLVNAVGSGGMTGVQWGAANVDDGNVLGFQAGLLNMAKQNFEGFQYGWVNIGHHVTGFQLGLVNYAGTMNGIQIGIINMIRTGGEFPVFPIVNWSF